MPCDSPICVTSKMGERFDVPCGKCPPCKHRRVNEWVFRLLEQEKVSTSAHFVTLTYDTTHVPISANGYMTLNKRDVQLFFKRLRKSVGEGIKYFCVGEYGTHTRRPHYHAIIFNVVDSSQYDQAWGQGSVHVGNVSGDSVAYTLKYMDKLHNRRLHGRDDRILEFSLMSKGLGANYLTPQIVAYHKADLSRYRLTKPGGYYVSMPKYYRRKIYSDSERKRQTYMVQDALQQNVAEEQRKFQLLYGSIPGYDFATYQDQKRVARFQKFYNQISLKRNAI